MDQFDGYRESLRLERRYSLDPWSDSKVISLNTMNAASSRKPHLDIGADGNWTNESILLAICGAIGRRVLHPKMPNTTLSWTRSDEGDPSMIFTEPATGRISRYFECVNNTVLCNLELSHYLSYVGKRREGDLPKTMKNHIPAKTLRDVFRSYMTNAEYEILGALFYHHYEHAEQIVKAWEKNDFEYYLTVDPSHPLACPLFDYKYIARQIALTTEVVREVSEHEKSEARVKAAPYLSQLSEVLQFPGGANG